MKLPNQTQALLVLKLAKMNGSGSVDEIIQKVVKIQAVMRAKLVRIKIRKLKRKLERKEETGGVFDNSITKEDFLFNDTVREAYNRHGSYTAPATPFNSILVAKDPYRMKNSSMYWGQWTYDLKTRTGLGVFVWLNGSLYEG